MAQSTSNTLENEEEEEEQQLKNWFDAVKSGDMATIKSLVAENSGLLSKFLHNRSNLYIAAQNGCMDVVNFLLDKKVDPVCNAYGRETALHPAAQNGHSQIIARLLQVPQLNVNARNRNGFSPLHLAAQNGHQDVIKELLKSDEIEVNILNYKKYRSTANAMAGGEENYSEELKIAKQSALAWAVEKGHSDVVNLLLKDERVNPNIESGYKTPLDLAIEYGRVDIFKALRTHEKFDYIDPLNPDRPVNFDSLLATTEQNHARLSKLATWPSTRDKKPPSTRDKKPPSTRDRKPPS